MAHTSLRSTLFLTTIASSMMAACASPPPPTPASTPPVISASHQPRAPFVPAGQPVDASTASTLTLEQLLIWADAHSPVIQTARARVGISRAELLQAQIFFPANPQLGLSTGARATGDVVGLELDASLQQQLEIFGEQDARQAAARANQRTSERLVDEARWLVHVQTHQLFTQLLLAQERAAQAARFVAFAKRMTEVASRQVQAGDASPLILLVAQADLAQTNEVMITASLQVQATRSRLATLIGWLSQPLPPITGSLPPLRHAPALPKLLELMRRYHPALSARELAIKAQEAQLKLSRLEANPKPTVGLSYAREAAGSINSPGSNIFLFNLTIPLPIWRTNQGPQAQAEAQVLVATRERDALVTQMTGALTQAIFALDAAYARVELYQTGVVPQLEQNLSLLERAYELGEVDVHQVSQTRQRLLEATSQYLDARMTYYQTAAALEGLVGAELWNSAEVAP